jgi:hypothetical protein
MGVCVHGLVALMRAVRHSARRAVSERELEGGQRAGEKDGGGRGDERPRE